MSLLLLVGTAVVSFTLGAFTIGMMRVHQDFSSYKAGYADGADVDLPPHQLEAEAKHAYIKRIEEDS